MTKAAHSAMEALRDENRQQQQQQYSVVPFKQHGYVSAFSQYPFQPPYQRLDVQSPAVAPAPTRSSPIPVDGRSFFFLEDCGGAAKRRKTTAVDPGVDGRPRHCHRTVLEPTGPK
jgi:hypothetical protein